MLMEGKRQLAKLDLDFVNRGIVANINSLTENLGDNLVNLVLEQQYRAVGQQMHSPVLLHEEELEDGWLGLGGDGDFS